MGHSNSKSRAMEARYAAEFRRFDMSGNPRMHPNIQSNRRHNQVSNRSGLTQRPNNRDWMKMQNPQATYEKLAYAPVNRHPVKLEKMETLPSLYQVSQPTNRAYYHNAASLQRYKTHSSPARHQRQDYNTYDSALSQAVYRQQDESPFKRQYKNVLADKENMNYTTAGRFTATLPNNHPGSISKNQHGYEDPNRRYQQWEASSKYQPNYTDVEQHLVGPRVLPSKLPERTPSFPSGYSTEQDQKKPSSASYGELDSFYLTEIDGIQMAGDDNKYASKNSLAMTSRGTSPDEFGRFNMSNNNLTQVEDKPTKVLKTQVSSESSRGRFSAEQAEPPKDGAAYLSRTRERSSKMSYHGSSNRDDTSQSTSEESDVSDRRWRRKPKSQNRSEINFGDSDRNFHPSTSQKRSENTIDRKQRRTRNLSSRSPDDLRELSQSIKFRSSGPSELIWGNRPNNDDEVNKKFPSSNPQRKEPPRTGTIQRKSRRRVANSYAQKDVSSDEASSVETQTKNFESSGGIFSQASLIAQKAAERQERRNKAKLTRSATDFGDQSWRHTSDLPSKLEDLLKTIPIDEEDSKALKHKKKRKQKISTPQESSTAMSTQDLEKVIENQLAAALTSIMKQNK